jgi:glutamyl-tRNA reductase
LLLETCERIELYVACSGQKIADTMARSMPLWTVCRGFEAARHLLRVATGLDSRILGEKHVRGQVRRMVLEFQRSRRINPVLSKLGQLAIHVPRLVSRHTRFGASAVEIDQLAACQVAAYLNVTSDVEHSRPKQKIAQAVVLGTGCIGRRLCGQLSRMDGLSVTVTGRDEARAAALATACGGRARTLDWVRQHLQDFQVILGATDARDYLLRDSDFASCNQPMMVCDLSIPFVVDPAVAKRENVAFWSMDRLTELVNSETPDLESAERIVQQSLEGLVAWDRQRDWLRQMPRRDRGQNELRLEARKAS